MNADQVSHLGGANARRTFSFHFKTFTPFTMSHRQSDNSPTKASTRMKKIFPAYAGGEDEREAIRQITQTGNRHQNAKSSGEITRPEKQIPINQTCKAKKNEVNAKAVVMQ